VRSTGLFCGTDQGAYPRPLFCFLAACPSRKTPRSSSKTGVSNRSKFSLRISAPAIRSAARNSWCDLAKTHLRAGGDKVRRGGRAVPCQLDPNIGRIYQRLGSSLVRSPANRPLKSPNFTRLPTRDALAVNLPGTWQRGVFWIKPSNFASPVATQSLS
jgi:hypothetical protein